MGWRGPTIPQDKCYNVLVTFLAEAPVFCEWLRQLVRCSMAGTDWDLFAVDIKIVKLYGEFIGGRPPDRGWDWKLGTTSWS